MEQNPTPNIQRTVIRLDFAANQAAPILGEMIGAWLKKAGATVVNKGKVPFDHFVPAHNLAGLTVIIGESTWVRQQQVDMWLEDAIPPAERKDHP